MFDTDENTLFERLYNKYVKLMFEIAKSFFDSEAEMEDAVQEAFIRLAANFK